MEKLSTKHKSIELSSKRFPTLLPLSIKILPTNKFICDHESSPNLEDSLAFC
jgi:hypothetical protein